MSIQMASASGVEMVPTMKSKNHWDPYQTELHFLKTLRTVMNVNPFLE